MTDLNKTLSHDSFDKAAEYLRLAIAKLSKHRLATDVVNYGLIYYYVSGKDVGLNEKVDEMLTNEEGWDNEEALSLFSEHICCALNGNINEDLRAELLMTIAQILGSMLDFAGKTAISNEALETHMEKLASTNEPKVVLQVASELIAETRNFVAQARDFETTVRESTEEISILKNELDQARKKAQIDALTALNNRGAFDDAMERTIFACEEEDSSFCLMLLDIDHFKKINDQYGHLVGDKVLVGLSSLLKKSMRGNDHLARYGGEEFAVILRDTRITGAFSAAENLRQSVERMRLKQVKSGQQIDSISISIGVASYVRGDTPEDLIQRCDQALYRAKQTGRNKTVIAD